MARPKSVVITAAEKKELLKAAKIELKEASAAVKAIAAKGKLLDRAEKDAARGFAAERKVIQKEATVAEKVVGQLQAKVASLSA